MIVDSRITRMPAPSARALQARPTVDVQEGVLWKVVQRGLGYRLGVVGSGSMIVRYDLFDAETGAWTLGGFYTHEGLHQVRRLR